MFAHNFKYCLKTLFKSKSLIFWSFAFPIILVFLFHLAFSNIENQETFNAMDIAIVNNENFASNQILKKSFEYLSDEDSEEQIFKTKYVSEDEAKNLLNNDEIVGYLKIEDDNSSKIIIKSNGINETIFKYVVEEVIQNSVLVGDVINNNIGQLSQDNSEIDYQKIYTDIYQIVMSQKANIKDTSSNNLSYTMIEYYTVIAMTCLYAGIIGIAAISRNLANMCSTGKRVSVSPISKIKIIFSSFLASYITALIGLAILYLFTIFVIKVDYGDNLLLVIILGIVGTLAGLSMGLAIGTILKTSETIKTLINIGVTMLGCFLSGMMGITMKYIIDKNIPIINKINPASMITDGFYSLYYYDTLNRYLFNIASLLIFSVIMIVLASISLRRQKYDSI